MKQQILAFLKTLQIICTYDKAAVIAGLVSAVTLLALRFGLNLNASDVAYLSAFFSAAVAAFTHVHFANKSKRVADYDALVERYVGILDKYEAELDAHAEKPAA